MATHGQLYIVATPIGNLNDITHRAIEVLQNVAIIAAEDTRHSARLLQHYAIDTRMIALHEHNEVQKKSWLIEQLQSGLDIALISDAGTPLISDPGYPLVNACRDAGLRVTPIPGACAVITALCASGLPTDAFQFLGFLPVKHQARENAFKAVQGSACTSIFYEAPRRIKDTLLHINEVLEADRQLVIAKELTKSFEQFFKGTAQQAVAWLEEEAQREKGEFVLLLAPAKKQEGDLPAEAVQLMQALLAELPAKKAAAIVAEHYHLKKNDLYKYSLSLK
ncbi:16S rRNA (cytidine(1402)-2'-O)-methyltransferase [Planctobacterium marinum]|uniref:16S rRNA (cytidine(1402)-2'-O)-methyltransferase n=1 Tax=Planctobacterium marinum TaxID=1631968 RepID=UPI001E5D6ACC|nr:16S rRNA (cytidine(1402)-2'-O)-methyltransferase [Planctobacterium marinum]MCC2604898.1 16S rRNA (cytidine(1402)-2'-O)-methyltransferase [Planctobacterium marinum]